MVMILSVCSLVKTAGGLYNLQGYELKCPTEDLVPWCLIPPRHHSDLRVPLVGRVPKNFALLKIQLTEDGLVRDATALNKGLD